MIRTWLFAVFCFLALPAAAAPPPSTESLIDGLTKLDTPVPGIDGGGMYDAFMGDDSPPQMVMGLLPAHAPTVPPDMREIVRRGMAAMPALLSHLDDTRPTALLIGDDAKSRIPLFHYYNDEYRPRVKPAGPCDKSCYDNGRPFTGPHIVTVGDVCFVLIGQIVNRPLMAARYQPTAILFVNSPTQSPELAARVRADWQGATATDLEASLLSDLRTAPIDGMADSALRRLRLYYPQTYAALTGDDAKKRDAFEAREKAPHP